MEYWQAALTVFQAHPVLGVGLGVGRYRVGDFLGQYSMMIHNDYVSVLLETGIIGFIVFLAWHYQWLVGLFKAYRNAIMSFDKTITLAVLIALVSIMVMRLTDNILLDSYDMYPICAMIAATLSISRIRQSEASTALKSTIEAAAQ
ncbi:hypothetical protein EG834_02915 [bacterium]|nr:hypothetical protein [bacterium]